MLVFKIIVTLFLMGSIPMWIRLVDVSSWSIAFVRLSWGLGLTALFFRKRIDWRRLLLREKSQGIRARVALVALGVCFAAHWLTYFESIQRSSATLGILALSTYGIHVTWLAALFSDKRPTAREWLAVAVSAAGAWLCLPTPDAEPGAFWGFVLGLVSGLFYAALPLLHQRQQVLSLPTRGAAQFLFAWLLFLPVAPTQSWQFSTEDWWILTALGVLCTFVGHNLWISITTEVRPATSGMLYYLSIPVTMLLETLVLKQPPAVNQILGATIIALGLISKNLALQRSRPGV